MNTVNDMLLACIRINGVCLCLRHNKIGGTHLIIISLKLLSIVIFSLCNLRMKFIYLFFESENEVCVVIT